MEQARIRKASSETCFGEHMDAHACLTAAGEAWSDVCGWAAGVQIATKIADEAIAASKLAAAAGAAFIDLNCGCPIYGTACCQDLSTCDLALAHCRLATLERACDTAPQVTICLLFCSGCAVLHATTPGVFCFAKAGAAVQRRPGGGWALCSSGSPASWASWLLESLPSLSCP